MNKKTVKDIDLKGRRVLMRVDFNVPLDKGAVADDTRIRSALPTIKYILENGASLVLMSHLGRPKGQVDDGLSLAPVAERLTELLGKPVNFAPDCVGAEVLAMAEGLGEGDVLLLENLRFHAEEEGKARIPEGANDEEKSAAKEEMKKKQSEFARQLAELGHVYVNDAFGTAHRAHASIAVVTDYLEDCAAGFLLEKEIEYLGGVISNPERPFVAIIGGAKISGKIDVVTHLLDKVDSLIIGGGMVYTFLKAQGIPVGNSLVEDDRVEMAKDILAKVEEKGIKFLLPVDHIIADQFSADAQRKVVPLDGIEDGWMALDIGPETIQLFSKEISGARTIVWNGPMGCFEMEPFAKGTMEVTRAVAENDGISIVGGGDSVNAINASKMGDQITHISTGGGASLEFLEGKILPGVSALSDK